MRLCRDQERTDEDIAIGTVEIYIRSVQYACMTILGYSYMLPCFKKKIDYWSKLNELGGILCIYLDV